MRHRIASALRNYKHLKLKIPRFQTREDDCFIASWPRSGNTWLRHLVLYALMPERAWEMEEVERLMPNVGRPDLKRMLPGLAEMPRRMFKSHDPFLPFYLGGRVVYIIRHGQDAMVSFYHYRTKLNRLGFSWNEFLRHTLNGRYAYGSWHTHVAGWLEHAEHPNIRLIRYEDMLADAGAQLRSVLEHFGFSVPDDRIAAAVERANVKQVNKALQQYAEARNRTFDGGLGGGRGKSQAVFSPEEARLFETYAGPLMHRLNYHIHSRQTVEAVVDA